MSQNCSTQFKTSLGKMMGGNPLINLIANNEWQRASLMLKENGNLVRKWSVAPSLTGGVAAADILPIHQACKMSDITIEFLESLLWAYPEGIRKTESGFRRLPLHIAIRARASDEVILYLIDKYPDSVAHQDVLGRVPIHYAISNHCSLELLRTLIRICPSTSRASDNLGWTPLHVAANAARSLDMVKIVIENGREATVAVTKKGNTPLACCQMSEGVDRELIEEFLAEEEKKFDKTSYFQNFREAEVSASNRDLSIPPTQGGFWGQRKLKRSSSFRLVV